MKTPLAFLVLFGVPFLLLLPAKGRAEIATAESIEWVLADSDRVLIGKVTRVDNVSDRDNNDCQAVTIAVAQALKGAYTERATFLLRPCIYEAYAKQWLEESIPTVFCLIKNDGTRISVPADRFPWLLRDDNNDPSSVLLGKSKNQWTGCIPVLTRDFEVLDEPERILKYLEQTLKAFAKDMPRQSHILEVPQPTAVFNKLYGGSAVELTVPVDQKLEALGERWCRSSSPIRREEGARILRHFKNAKNIALLKSLLEDPTTCECERGRLGAGTNQSVLVYRKKLYPVRIAAYHALLDLGVKVERPLLHELLEGHDEPDDP